MSESLQLLDEFEDVTDDSEKRLEHEEAAHEKRQWVRLTSMCNNLCTFCLDTLAHNGTMGSDDEIKKRIIDGRRKGATRLILSGGEPTIHPQYVKYIKYGRMAGYRRIQTVTNGRMLSYPAFMNRCLDAGLQEITFSVHGHNAKVHDALVGVHGAFEQEVKAIELALADGRPIVNIDVCLNKGNIKKLPELLDRFIGMGVKEYDLLHLIPFGMAWDEKHRNSLVYDLEDAHPYIQAALKVSERPDIHIWFNRFPPPYLEGYEHLIQDPYKLNDEARGRYEEYELWLTRDMPISCREKERCDRCYLQHFCDTLEDTKNNIEQANFDAYRIDVSSDPDAVPAPGEFTYTWLQGKTVESVLSLCQSTGQNKLILELASFADASQHLDGDTLEGREVARVLVSNPDDIDSLLAAPGTFEVQVKLTSVTAAHLLENYPDGHARLSLLQPNYDRASLNEDNDADLHQFFEAFQADITVENIPECISGRAPRQMLTALDSTLLRKKMPDYAGLTPGDTGGRGSILKALGELTVGDPAKTRKIKQDLERLGPLKPIRKRAMMELFGYSKGYIQNEYYTKSLRCSDCPVTNQCRGVHINYARTHGFKALNPVADACKPAA